MDSQLIRTLCITGTSAEWATHNIILAKGELGYDSTNKALKVGDGITPFLSLPAASTWASGAILDNVADGTSYARLQKAKADALNAGTQVAPTAAGAADANAIAEASGSTLGARLETLTGQVVTVVALTAGADWVDIIGWMFATSSLHLVSSFDNTFYNFNLFVVGAGRNGACFVLGNTPSPRQVLSFQTVLSEGYQFHKLQCKAPTYNATVTVKTIMANP